MVWEADTISFLSTLYYICGYPYTISNSANIVFFCNSLSSIGNGGKKLFILCISLLIFYSGLHIS